MPDETLKGISLENQKLADVVRRDVFVAFKQAKAEGKLPGNVRSSFNFSLMNSCTRPFAFQAP